MNRILIPNLKQLYHVQFVFMCLRRNLNRVEM